MMQAIAEAAETIRTKLSAHPFIALILGSGLGDFADRLENPVTLSYSDIPHFPVSTAPFHKGQLVAGYLKGKYVILLNGRIHYYEGYSMEQVVFPVRVLKTLGVKTLVVTNAAGAINLSYQIGDLMVISDHIKFFSDSPLRGKNIDVFGPRFCDMTEAYTPSLRILAQKLAGELSIPLHEGVYAYMSGPSYETPAEIRMLRTLGADVVGMSTVPEVLTAAHAGMQIFGLSFCTNMAAGIEKEIKELAFTEKAKDHFSALICAMIEQI